MQSQKIDITEFIDGQVKTYGAWDNLRVNDQLTLTYSSNSLDITGIHIRTSKLHLFMLAHILEVDQLIEWEDGDIAIKSIPIGPTTEAWFGEDYISAYQQSFDKTAISRRRYYKNDWEAIITKISHDDSMVNSSTVALSCRHKKNSIKQVIKELKEFVSGIE